MIIPTSVLKNVALERYMTRGFYLKTVVRFS